MSDELDDRTSDAGVTLRLALRGGEPVSGVVVVDGVPGETEFSGWVELMAAVNAARAAAGDGAGEGES